MIDTVAKLAESLKTLPPGASICFTDGQIVTGHVYELHHVIDCVNDNVVIFILKELDDGTVRDSGALQV